MSDRALPRLLPAALAALAEGRRLALATVVETQGSTYRKAGARMLIGEDGVLAGVLGGGCFDSDLAEQAQGVLHGSGARLLEYDMRAPEEAIWGLGLGCEGLVQVFLQPLGPDHRSVLDGLATLIGRPGGGALATLVEPLDHRDCGQAWILGDGGRPAGLPMAAPASPALVEGDDGRRFFCEPVRPSPLLVLCGAGVDALPVLELARCTGWRVQVLDHRPGHARAERFPGAEDVRVFDGSVDAFAGAEAAVVMSHDLRADLRYLRALTGSPVTWIGLLGPTARRARLLEAMGPEAERLEGRLRGPAGLNLGGELPEEVAFSIVAELQALHYGTDARPLTGSGVK